MRWQVAHSPQKSSVSRSQLDAWANMCARVYFADAARAGKEQRVGHRPERNAPRNAATIFSFPREFGKTHDSAFAEVCQERLTAWKVSACNVFREPYAVVFRIEALNGGPGAAAREYSYIPRRLPGGEDSSPAGHALRWYSCVRTCAPQVSAIAPAVCAYRGSDFRAACRRSCIPDARSSENSARFSGLARAT